MNLKNFINLTNLNKSFSSKVYAAVLGMLILLTCAFTLLSLQSQRRSIEQEIVRDGGILAGILADNVRLGIFAMDAGQLATSTAPTLEVSGVVGACVFSQDGQLLHRQALPAWEQSGICRQVQQAAVDASFLETPRQAHSVSDQLAVTFWKAVQAKPAQFSDEGLYFSGAKTGQADQPQRIGAVGVVFDREVIRKSMHQTLVRHALILLLFLGIGGFASYYLVQAVSRPLTRLVAEIRGREDLGEGRDELGLLSDSYTAMVEDLGESFATISELKEGLEDKVFELEQEIRRRQRTEESLRESEEKFRSISEGIADGVAIVRNGIIVWANKAFRAIFGCDAGNLASHDPALLMPQPGQRPGSPWLLECLGGTEAQVRFLALSRRDDGQEILVEVSARKMLFEGQEAIQVIVRDNTEQERAEKRKKEMELKALSQSKLASLGKIATGVAHEINQPLSYIRIAYESVLRDLEAQRLDPVEAGETLREALRQVSRITSITDHLRSFGRADTSLLLEEVSLPAVLANSLTLMSEILRLANVELTREIAEGLPPLRGNSVQLEQVFINLFQNSVDALSATRKRTIRVAMRQVGRMIETCFSDSGPGIPVADRPRIFEPFYSTKGGEDRTGLGLAIVSSIVREHGGTITYRELPGWGASFEMLLPARRDEGGNGSGALGQGPDNI